MASILDLAKDLGKAMANSDEYKSFKAAEAAVEGNPAAQMMLRDFRVKQFELERSRMMGEELSPQLLEEFRSKQEVIMYNPVIRDFLVAEQRFGNIMLAVQRIIGEAVGLDLSDGDDHECGCGEGSCGEGGCGEGCSCS